MKPHRDHPNGLDTERFDETARVLSVRDAELFLAIIEADSVPNEALRIAAERYQSSRRSAANSDEHRRPNC